MMQDGIHETFSFVTLLLATSFGDSEQKGSQRERWMGSPSMWKKHACVGTKL